MFFFRNLVTFTTLIVFGSASYLAPFNQSSAEDIIPDQYIVHFHANHTLDDHYAFIGRNLTAEDDNFDDMDFLPGYCTLLNNDTLHDLVRTDPGVKLVEHNVWRRITPLSGDTAQHSKRQYVPLIYNGSPYNQRMVASYIPLDTPVGPGPRVTIFNQGQGVDIYIIDTGVRITSVWFQGRASHFRNNPESPYTGTSADDDNGHGTAVAGVAAANLYGTAHAANIINVKAIPADGRQADNVYARAVNDVTNAHNAKLAAEPNLCFRGSVINMSYGSGSYSVALQTAVAAAMAAGIVLVAAAGEAGLQFERQDYPCAYGSVICVGSTDNTYNLAPGSNYGNPVRIYAPGENIVTVGWRNDNQILDEETVSGSGDSLNSGTSFAAPHIAGLAATFMSWSYLPAHPVLVWYLLVQNAIRGNIGLVGSGSLFGTSGINHPLKAPYQPYYGGPQNPNFQPRPRPVENSASEDANNSTWSPVENNAITCPGWPPYEFTHFGSSGSSPLIGDRMGSDLAGGPWGEVNATAYPTVLPSLTTYTPASGDSTVTSFVGSTVTYTGTPSPPAVTPTTTLSDFPLSFISTGCGTDPTTLCSLPSTTSLTTSPFTLSGVTTSFCGIAGYPPCGTTSTATSTSTSTTSSAPCPSATEGLECAMSQKDMVVCSAGDQSSPLRCYCSGSNPGNYCAWDDLNQGRGCGTSAWSGCVGLCGATTGGPLRGPVFAGGNDPSC